MGLARFLILPARRRASFVRMAGVPFYITALARRIVDAEW